MNYQDRVNWGDLSYHKLVPYTLAKDATTLAQTGHACLRSLFPAARLQSFLDNALEREARKLYAAISSPDYSHARAGTYAGGGLNGLVHIYHRDAKSPTGVKHAASGEAPIADYLIRKLRNNSALSPTERR